jgi:hypothetical protein
MFQSAQDPVGGRGWTSGVSSGQLPGGSWFSAVTISSPDKCLQYQKCQQPSDADSKCLFLCSLGLTL